ncbi:hypothetical protein L596_013210 [Steinernema carpocapsae]|uniref:BTB domain-containing protein n=1 Tax=Steinernema carpocapsae TaxID=34508 RepID=A0A4U5NZZ5_STECR|nr:hypothetical protein L596_013210 [Steinernema carpocapsae]
MDNEFVIPFKFTNNGPVSVEIGDFEWTLYRISCGTHRTKSGVVKARTNCYSIRCEPNNKGRKVLWKFAAMGTFAVVHKANRSIYHVWHQSFDNDGSLCHFHHQEGELSKALRKLRKHPLRLFSEDVSGELHVVIVISFVTDLSDPKNAFVKDAFNFGDHFNLVRLEPESHKRELLLTEKAFVNLELMEQNHLVRVLKSPVGDEMMLQFLSIIHGLDVLIDGDSVEGLTALAVFLKHKRVLRLCEEFFCKAPLSLAKKLALCDRFKLEVLLKDTVNKMSTDELMWVSLLAEHNGTVLLMDPKWEKHLKEMVDKRLRNKFLVGTLVSVGVVGSALVALTWFVRRSIG